MLWTFASIKDTEKVDIILDNFAESSGFTKIKGKTIRYQNINLPIEFGRKGKVFHILGIGPIIGNQISVKEELNKFFVTISDRNNNEQFPTSLANYFANSGDISAYFDGSGFAKVIEDYWPEDRWKNLVPLLDPFFNRQLGLNIVSKNGLLKMVATDYTIDPKKTQKPPHTVSLIQRIPEIALCCPLQLTRQGPPKFSHLCS